LADYLDPYNSWVSCRTAKTFPLETLTSSKVDPKYQRVDLAVIVVLVCVHPTLAPRLPKTAAAVAWARREPRVVMKPQTAWAEWAGTVMKLVVLGMAIRQKMLDSFHD